MKLSIIPSDKTIVIDGEALQFDFVADSDIHAIQWYGSAGTIEYKAKANEWFNDVAIIQPYVDGFNAQKAILAAEELAAAELAAIEASKPPKTVTMRQARLALLGAGLLGNVNAALNALPSPQKDAALIEWEYSQEVQRDKGLVLAMKGALGLTDKQLDDLFIAASKL